METKVIKMKCQKHGKYFCAELKQINGSWKVVNFIPVSVDEYDALQSEIRQSVFVTNENLVACRKCGNRNVSGCLCSSSILKCCNNTKYDFNCIYCNKLEIDYSFASKKLPYNQWAGVSNIPDAIKDKYGNPSGSQYDLAMDNAFSGYKIVVLNLCRFCDLSKPKAALEKKGFEVIEYTIVPDTKTFKQVLYGNQVQLWIVSDEKPIISDTNLQLIKQFFESGNGIYIWGDNWPFYADANRIMNLLFNTGMSGDRPGDTVLGIQKSLGAPGIIANHLITTGITNFYEGKTIAEIHCNNKLKPLIYGSEKQVVTAYYDNKQRRALVDGGFTRLYYKWESAGTDRYIVNAAAWLANIERFGYFQ